MKVVFTHRVLDDYREAVEIEIDGELVFEAYDGEPEDNCIMRNFNDTHKIPELMEKAFNAALDREGLEIIRQTKKGWEEDE